MTPEFFRERMELLAKWGYTVLPLAAAVRQLYSDSLPPKSVAITFDEGFYDFFVHGYPVLSEFGYPATVYQTTCYCEHPYPVFHLIISYLLWRGKGRTLNLSRYGLDTDLGCSGDNSRATRLLIELTRERRLTIEQKNEFAAEIADELGLDYQEILRSRMLQLMNHSELATLSNAGIDFELHTHRHRTPVIKEQFVSEIRENREILSRLGSASPAHFCYPNGVYKPEFLPWLRAQNVSSATTCDSDLAHSSCDPLLLPRFVDSMCVSAHEFEGWLSGVSSWLPRRKWITRWPSPLVQGTGPRVSSVPVNRTYEGSDALP
jgi:peptidoglycan/xylan/chitin deacetylase (PgdA/CDA1 family)